VQNGLTPIQALGVGDCIIDLSDAARDGATVSRVPWDRADNESGLDVAGSMRGSQH